MAHLEEFQVTVETYNSLACNTLGARDRRGRTYEMAPTRRETALSLAEELLTDIELARMPPPDFLKKATRLARLLDDIDAMAWLSFEMTGYPSPLNKAAVDAAAKSGRKAPNDKNDGGARWYTTSLSQLQADVDAGMLQIQAAADAPVSVSSANPAQFVMAPPGNTQERGAIRNLVGVQQGVIGKVVGSVHQYVSEREIELRFGAAVESAFAVVRNDVDARIAKLAPTAAVKLASAFENASSNNPEDWANAAAACRRLLKAIADELSPAGEPVGGRPMTDDKYINRLISWIVNQGKIGSTLKDVVTSDLEDFGKRIDAFDDAGHKGAHAEVTQYEASRFITGAYLLIGDILSLWAEVTDAPSVPEAVVELEAIKAD
ncbi:hypothetical protein E3T46_01015 [Cryobacterium sp. Hh11]|uniref:AbiTii domain-containing protein n=1 Tax=Cryobacterium sp. Hh11 TaxID=2555868 RepID=UPI00106C84E4|nr:hypothetical protein [Cryobacterium sp. Hh11]TFD54269.1 hypothetical protein E3T46_01015 [Cryobacterium sp. Hh11]